MNDDTVRTQFDQQGFVVVRNLLDADEVHFYIEHLKALSGFEWHDASGKRAATSGQKTLDRSWNLPDGVTKTPDFWPLIFHVQLLEWVRKILGPEIRYLQHSDLHVGKSSVSWHRDSVNRSFGKGSEWGLEGDPYRLMRCAIYLQPYEESGSQLGLVPGSHLPEHPISLRRRWNESKASLLALTNRVSFRAQGVGINSTWIRTEPGDVILFDPRILHAGSYITGPKYSMFVGFGIENSHFWNHRNYYRYVRKDLGYEDAPAELVARLEAADLYPGDPGETTAVDDAWVPNPFIKRYFLNKGGKSQA